MHPTGSNLRFDCTAAIDSWETVWTDEKKADKMSEDSLIFLQEVMQLRKS